VIGSIILANLDAAVDMARKTAAAGVRVLEFNIGNVFALRGRKIVQNADRVLGRVQGAAQIGLDESAPYGYQIFGQDVSSSIDMRKLAQN
jgi:hypothetical protein